ncbi:MAG: hypothetical protein LAN62_07730 [Acidobacteriia bacterium]|nr:hypothetical protein [Terriglobia bacterium]
MLESHHVVTPTAFIMGQINISGMSGRGFSTEVRVIAKGNGQVTETTARNESSYVLLVSPGAWTVTAQVGGVASEPQNITLDPGQTVEIHFWFGRRP